MQNSNYPILYSFRRCPYAMRARLAIKLSTYQVELREIILKNKPIDMLKASPKGTVPVLIIDDKIIDESLDIMLWALSDHKILNKLKTESMRLISQNDDDFKANLDLYKYANRHPEKSPEQYRQQGEAFLNELNLMLSHTKFLLSEKMSLADIAIFPFIRQFAHVDREWFFNTKYTHLIDWLNNFLDSELFLSIMSKYSEYVLNKKVIIF
ncbi:MAG: glutathione S-transferase [Candidatus Cloacimonadota bacterium]|nr:MAG: glutathione S-transferase [Candidatus Cloacimonadota bacterium]